MNKFVSISFYELLFDLKIYIGECQKKVSLIYFFHYFKTIEAFNSFYFLFLISIYFFSLLFYFILNLVSSIFSIYFCCYFLLGVALCVDSMQKKTQTYIIIPMIKYKTHKHNIQIITKKRKIEKNYITRLLGFYFF